MLLLLNHEHHSLLTDHGSPGFACVRMSVGQHRGRGPKGIPNNNPRITKFEVCLEFDPACNQYGITSKEVKVRSLNKYAKCRRSCSEQ